MAKNTDRRTAEGPVGTPQGKHSEALDKKGECRCGRCSNKRLGWPKTVVVTLK